MNLLLHLLEQNAGVILLCLILIVFADGLFRVCIFSKRRSAVKSGTRKNENAFLQMLNCSSKEAFALLEEKTLLAVWVSDNMEQVTGVPGENIFMDSAQIFAGLSESDKEKFIALYHSWDRKEEFCFEDPWSYQSKSGLQIRIEIICKDGRELFHLRNVSEEKEQLEQMREMVEEAKRGEEAKTNFLSNMSHEIRTPLNGMLGMIELAKMNPKDADRVADYLGKAEELSRFLLSVINDILDMSRIESGKTELESVAFDICAMGEKLENMFQGTMADKGIDFYVDYIEIEEPFVFGDQLRISQILTNFLSNSSKFTPEGGTISLTIRQMNSTQTESSWMLQVKDTGKGMDGEFLHKLFRPFEQENGGIARKYGGSGLGMTIADSLVHLMDGQILVDSEIGKGSTFTVFLKLPIAKKEDIIEEETVESGNEAVSLEGRRILMAEDQKINAVIVVRMMQSKGVTIDVAENGKLVTEMFAASKPGYYDAILMDIQMPEMNGWDAAKCIRAMEREDAKQIPIFALSADAFVENKRKSVESGMNAHITKPIDFKELENYLKTAFKESGR